MNKKDFFTCILLSIILFTSAYISGFNSVLELILGLIVYCFIFYGIHTLIQILRRKEKYDFDRFLHAFLYKISLSIFIIGGILASGAYYFNHISPAGMPEFTISNGKKTVVFQAMSHIGSDTFYKTVQQNLTQKKQEGFVYFFEGVRPGTSENQDIFNQAMGIKFDKNLYKNFSKLYGVVYQNNEIFLNRVNNLDFNIDLSIDDIVRLYKGKDDNKKHSNLLENGQVIDANEEIITTLASLNERQLSILRYINKAILNIIVQSEGIQDTLTQNFSNKALFDVILNERNKLLSQNIENSQYNKIYITYGLLHFQGVFENLKKNDPQWHIISKKELFPIQ